MKNIQKVAVLGGGGRTGKFIVKKLLEEGYSVKALIRDPTQLQSITPALEVIIGDALDKKKIDELVSNTHAIISTIGQRPNEPLVSSTVTRNVLDTIAVNNICRYLSVAGINLDIPTDRKGAETLAATEYMKTKFPDIQKDRQQALVELQHSESLWTVVRVPFILFEPGENKIIVDRYDCLGETIKAGDIASFLIQQLHSEEYIRQAPFICN